ncbi:hypothetical protein AX15_003165 [Amanita polypyramis BW_CC]|nr:hypothetical protein AX15_003165 [Amanita polypyramis BW_CC]
MSVSIDIVSLTDSVDMYGMPDTSSAYSLSGHVAVCVKPSHSLFERRSTTHLLLQSLLLTFEGQTETVTPRLGYSAARLCSFSRELVTAGPAEVNNEGEEDSTDPCVWNVVFNIPIPGWLPETTSIGLADLGVKYTLYATAKFINDHHVSSPWALATLCTPFRSRARYARAQKPIHLRRFVEPPSEIPFRSPTNHYMIKTPSPLSNNMSIPAEVLEKIEVVVATPEFVDIHAGTLPVTLRMRASGLEAAQRKRLQVKEIAADLTQKENYRSLPSSSYLETYPVPPKNRQPPNEPLLARHPVGNIYDYGIVTVPSQSLASGSHITSFLPAEEPGRHRFPKYNYSFTDDSAHSDNPDWYTIEIGLPFVSQKTIIESEDWWSGVVELQPSMRTPLFDLTHQVALSVTLSYDGEADQEPPHDRLTMRVPITMVHTLPPVSVQGRLASTLLSSPFTMPRTMPPMNPYTLPAYSQLYDKEGERKIDYSIPLPLYEPPNTLSSTILVNEESSTNTKSSLKLRSP